MSVHINANPGDIAPVVLLPGDPLRAKFIAEKYLQNAQLVSKTRNVFFYTGTYNNTTITVGSSGMGCPSIGIYSFELYTEYKVESIIRIGTCGAYNTSLQLFDIINVQAAASESTYALHAWGIKEDVITCKGNAFDTINAITNTAKQQTVHCSDIFYRKETAIPPVAVKHNCNAVEMETFALFANAQYLQKNAAALLTVSDIIPTHEKISAAERETALLPMMELALDAAIKL
jgi:purine-nucleoside phosphorylase